MAAGGDSEFLDRGESMTGSCAPRHDDSEFPNGGERWPKVASRAASDSESINYQPSTINLLQDCHSRGCVLRFFFMKSFPSLTAALLAALAFSTAQNIRAEDNAPPAGFTTLFNGKDLAGWVGGSTFDQRKLAAMPDAERKAKIDAWTKTMTEANPKTGKPHWNVENGELVNDGFGAYATTDKDYGDFELLVEYKTVPLADSGIYLRGCPQVQIWDYTEQAKFKLGADKGSGGLWNNSPGAPGKDPLVLADKPFGEWNKVRVVMTGSRVSVWLNDKLVVDHAVLENYYDRKTPVPARGPIELQTHGGEIRWRNVFLREIGSDEADKILASRNADGFKSYFNGKDLDGWSFAGPPDMAKVVDGAIVWQEHKGGTLYTNDEFTDFVARVEFKLPPGGNNGLAIRYPGQGDTAYEGMCEVQVLDDTDPKYAKLDERQYCGSVYAMVAAHRGYQHPLGEWNFYEVTVKGPTIHVELNGTPITDADVSKITPEMFMHNHPHPGKDRPSGHFGFAGHNDPVAFRNVAIKAL
jgi:3-keto-disaccharide hydrolase